MTDNKKLLLASNLAKATTAADWLRKSFIKCQGLNTRSPIEEASFDVLENLTSRFARHSDILMQKVFRLIDQIELEPQPTLIDTLHRSAKRGFLDDKTLEDIRELRNSIAHEYSEEDLEALFREVLRLTPKLLELQIKIVSYCKKFS